jgi:hypothetical protein
MKAPANLRQIFVNAINAKEAMGSRYAILGRMCRSYAAVSRVTARA